MSTATPPSPTASTAAADTAPPAQRLLHTATKLFAAQGIRAVGIDQILRQAGVAKASLYSSYGSKEALVIAYLNDLDQRDRKRWTEAVADMSDPTAKILAFFDLAATAARARDFRGCLYANAATEFPEMVFEPVRAHRDWMRNRVAALLAAADVSRPDAVARQIQLLYDGALAGSKMQRSTAPIKLARQLTEELLDRR